MQMNKKVAAVSAGALSLLGAGSAMADAADYGSILVGLDLTSATTAVIGAGVLIAGIGFAVWATKKVARFFG